MIPIENISGAVQDALFFYLAAMSLIMIIATWLRVKVSFLRRFHIPASLLAGFIGLALGPYFLKVIPQEVMNCYSNLAGRLIVIVFAPMLMGVQISNIKKLAKTAGATYVVNWFMQGMQFAVPMLLGAFALTPIFGTHGLFGTIIDAGWYGGHGTAGGLKVVYEELGWVDGHALAVTSATIGLAFGIIAGVSLINIAVKRGWTNYLKESVSLEAADKELFTPEESTEGTKTTVSSGVIDTLAFHASLIGVAAFIGWFITKAIKIYFNITIGWFVTAMIGGLIVQLTFGRTKWGQYIDKNTLNRLQGLSLEFLVAGAVASLQVPIVIAYWKPLLIQQGIMAVLMVWFVVWLSPRTIPEDWFENSMVIFGTGCGVMATGLLLLKTADPEAKSNALTVTAARTALGFGLGGGGGLLTGIVPSLVIKYGQLKTGLAFLALMVAMAILIKVFGWWNPHPFAKSKGVSS
jgi:ESS family glutamate:Na+ symporter